MLNIRNLEAHVVDGPQILHGIDLDIAPGELHIVMGPNGSGKSTLARILAGHPEYEATAGYAGITLDDGERDLLAMEAHERARAGIFLAFQYPVAIPGVSNELFLRTSFNAICKAQGIPPLDAYDFQQLLAEKLKILEMDSSYLSRPVNLDFSGGEKKRNEILQMALLSPRLAILDEIDSGLDVDALRIVCSAIEQLRSPTSSTLIITHYQRMLHYLKPDAVHVLARGRIVKSGDHTLAAQIENEGYDAILEQA
jgi:Fe-S cluster assembly ATP-binding protein